MHNIKLFQHDTRGSMVEKIAAVAAIVTISGVAGANFLARMVEHGELPIIILARSDADMRRLAAAPALAQSQWNARGAGATRPSSGLDMSATASIPNGANSAPSLTPCGKDRK